MNAPIDESPEQSLALYHFPGCPYCRRVRATIEQLGIDVELRNIHEDSRHWDQLIEARGRSTVPVLRIVAADGAERWMPESSDIIDYLQQTYGESISEG